MLFGICAVTSPAVPYGCKFSLKVHKIYSYGLMLQQHPQHNKLQLHIKENIFKISKNC